ncbi:MAG: glutathione S-transferase family protein [Kofleriaceae bacterium]
MTMTDRVKLITIPFSHYCEKARWALDACRVAYDEDGHLPLFHYVAVRGKKSVPILVAGRARLTDSTDIVAWADAKKPGTLLPADARTRDEALALEDDFDCTLGPATRRWAYFQLLPRKDLDDVLVRGVPRWQVIALGVTRPIAVNMLRRGLKIDEAGAERSRQKIEDTFDAVDQRLSDGRPYLAGDRFSVADLAFAALASPILFPRQHPIGLPPVDTLAPLARSQVEAWRDRPAGRHGLAMYERHRAA